MKLTEDPPSKRKTITTDTQKRDKSFSVCVCLCGGFRQILLNHRKFVLSGNFLNACKISYL